jgi:1-acyl-sn-glycerol-3-phosphate acyltransferase
MADKTILKEGVLKFVWHQFCHYLSVAIVATIYRLKAYGRKNIPQSGPVLILSNHQSMFDPIFCQNWIWRPFYFVPRDTLLDIPFWGRLFRSFFIIPIKRGQADIAAMKTIIDVLKQDKTVCLFPEGTRTHDGRIGKIKPGFGLISRRTGATIVPMVIDGIFEAWPRTRKLPKLGKVAVIYGDPISPEYIKQKSDDDFAAELTQTFQKLQADLRTRLGKQPYGYDDNQTSTL